MKADWWSCDGGSRTGTGATASQMTRRSLFTAAAIGSISWLADGRSALAQIALNPVHRRPEHVLVVIFLRGGADGLNVIVPHGEDAYYRLRPSLGIAKPTDRTANERERALDLDGFYGFHP